MTNELLIKNTCRKIAAAQIICLLLMSGFAYSQGVSGTVTSGATVQPLPGVSILIKGTTKGTNTDAAGNYHIDAKAKDVLVFSYINYKTKEVVVGSSATINIVLVEGNVAVNEVVVVTGVFDKRTALQSSIAISTLSSKAIGKMSPNSAADLLSYTPGVYVNSANGEINNTVYSRGVAANQFGAAGGNGYYYVSMMEDGLPVSNISSGNIVADYFYRADATLNHLESVRGGSASITGANAPGGIFNYISRTGKEMVNEITYKVGLEGNGHNLYNRLDGNFGGKLGRSGWFFNAGGFYRSAQGNTNPGYKQNQGGQVKANIMKSFEKGGFIKIYGKYLDDKNGLPQDLPATNYSKPQLVSGFTNTSTWMLPGAITAAPLWNKTDLFVFDPRDMSHSKDAAIGTELSIPLGKGFTLSNNIKFTHKNEAQNLAIFSSPTSLTDFATYLLMGGFGTAGTYTYSDRFTGNALAKVVSQSGYDFSVANNSLPGNVMQDGVLFNFTSYSKCVVNEIMDQLSFNKKAGIHSLTFGSFFASSHDNLDPSGPVGTNVRSTASGSSPLAVTLTTPAGQVQQLTNPQGYGNLGGGGQFFRSFNTTQKQFSLFLADGIQASPNLNIDLGVRYDNIGVKGTNNQGAMNENATTGGIDGNPLTLYDNLYFVKGTNYGYNTNLNMVSYSAGVNYKLDNHNSVYARFSSGKKSPDLQYYYDNFLQAVQPVVKAQTITQFEMGYKFKAAKISGSFIPFYSNLKDIPVSAYGTDLNGLGYYAPVVYNEIRTFGLEAEAELTVSKNFSVRVNATVQSAKNVIWQTWNVRNNGRADDTLTNTNGNVSENIPKLMFNIAPTYSFSKGYVFISCKYMGQREANTENAFQLPGFAEFNFGAGYDITKKVSLSANINNLFNTFGIMNWAPSTDGPGGYFNVFAGHDALTAAGKQGNPNAVFQVLPIQSRAYFLSVKYRF